ncbi:MAG: hypothetical protein ACKOW2_07095 [Sphingobacteriaceae bacterium]
MRTGLFFSIVGIFWFTSTAIFAQKTNKEFVQSSSAPALLKVDGKLAEWQTGSFNENKASKLSFLLSNNDSTLYLAIKSTDNKDLRRLLIRGISFSVYEPEGKKIKQSLTFPIMSRGNDSQNLQSRKQAGIDPLTKLKADLAGLREIGISGFEEILDGKISVNNDYGIGAAASLDDQGLLACEYAIPLKLLQIDAFKNPIIACQIKVNGLNLIPNNPFPNQNYGMARPGDARGNFPTGMPSSELFQGTEFKVSVRLASGR